MIFMLNMHGMDVFARTISSHTMIQFANAKLPHLKGKGAAVKSMGKRVLRVWKRRMDAIIATHRTILYGLQGFVDIDIILDRNRDN